MEKLAEAHSSSLINKLSKEKHEALHREIIHIEQLLERC